MRKVYAMVVAAMICHTTTSFADEIWGITSYKHPFTGAQALRDAGFEVHLLLVDLNEQAMEGIRQSVRVSKNMSQDELHEIGKKVTDSVDVTVIEKALKADIATRVLAKKMGIKSIPAVVRYNTEGMTAHYGELDLVQAARQLALIQ